MALIIRLVALVALIALFVADFGFGALARDAPGEAYLMLVATVMVDNPKHISELLVAVVRRALNLNGEKPKE